MIKPTPGRVVWFTPHPGDPCFSSEFKPPFAAHVAYVHDDRHVNLMVISPEGHALQKRWVPLIQEGEALPTSEYCEWMPYQKGQAAKTEALEKKVGA